MGGGPSIEDCEDSAGQRLGQLVCTGLCQERLEQMSLEVSSNLVFCNSMIYHLRWLCSLLKSPSIVLITTFAVLKCHSCGYGGTDDPQQSELSGHQPQTVVSKIVCFSPLTWSLPFAISFAGSGAAPCSFSSAVLQVLGVLLFQRRADSPGSFT